MWGYRKMTKQNQVKQWNQERTHNALVRSVRMRTNAMLRYEAKKLFERGF